MNARRAALPSIVVCAMASGCSLLVSTAGLTGGDGASDAGADADARAANEAGPPDGHGDAGAPDAASSADADADVPPDPSLVLSLAFDDVGGGPSLADSSPYHATATLHGTARVVAGGKHGGALSLDGSSGTYVSVADAPQFAQIRALTVTAWVDVTYTPTNGRVVSMGNAFDVKINWQSTTIGAPQLTIDGTSYAMSSWGTTPAEWHHVAVVFENGTTTTYGDGIVRPLMESTIPPNAIVVPEATGMLVGALSDGSERYTGLLDDVRVYARALDAAEIASLGR